VGFTRFTAAHFLNSSSAGAPDPIPHSFDAAFSFHPIVSKGWKGTLSLEFKHFERLDIPFRKHLHLGIEIETTRAFFIWLGVNQLYATGGIGYRTKGGDLEIGTYAQDVGYGSEAKQDRRFLLRYSVGL
jgi:hypothetical protein